MFVNRAIWEENFLNFFSNWVGGIRSGSFRLKSLMRSCMIELSVLLRSCSIETTDNIAYLLCLARCKLKGKLVSMNAHHNYDAICFPDDFFFSKASNRSKIPLSKDNRTY
jgi:hypothetical protein